MNNLFFESAYFGTVLTLGSFLIGLKIKQKLKSPLAEPILTSSAIIICILLIFKIDYNTYQFSANNITYFLTPVTVSLALPMYRQLETLKTNLAAILISIFCGCLACALSIFFMSKVLGLSPIIYNSIQPKSVTTAIALGITKEFGGIEGITVISVVITGLLGSMLIKSICTILKIKSPIATGLAFGNAAHAIGTTKAIGLGETQGAMSSLSIAVAGVMTVIIAPIFSGLIK
ncbi:MAG: LrgB family protein [Clostridiales bacterium]|jgi:predicted murein hydrolase (TIGR00659 family)|nr:LrgB family protein [Clostridiales bacterium]